MNYLRRASEINAEGGGHVVYVSFRITEFLDFANHLIEEHQAVGKVLKFRNP
jgi:hypothetical protein